MNPLLRLLALMSFSLLAACGGGGGDSGTSPFPSSGGGGTTGGGTTGGTTVQYEMTVQVQRAGVATTQIASTETAQIVATVAASDGNPVEGVVVSFAETQGALLTLVPAAATALTDAEGRATIDVKAAQAANTGATTLTATATVGSTSISGARSIQINAGAITPGTPPVPGAINFVSSNPSGTAIVIKGAGGNGRSESAVLSFRIVDQANAPINSAQVDFTINSNNGGATISQASAVSSADGLASVSVSSGSQPASIVVTATAHDKPEISSQSDSLLVSNSVPVEGAFEIVAAKYNLDGRKTGDSTTISAFVADANGNPVPDGVAVSFQTSAGAVASSTQGGCLTTNGTCTVDFRVQDPRGDGLANVIATVRVGNATTLVQSLMINMAGAKNTPYLALNTLAGPVITKLTLTSCKQTFTLFLSDGNGRSTAAGTTIGSSLQSSNTTVSIKSGTPVLDQLDDSFSPTPFDVEVDLTSTSLVKLCKNDGTVADSAAFFVLNYTTPGGIVFPQRIELAYPQ